MNDNGSVQNGILCSPYEYVERPIFCSGIFLIDVH